jgi:hypothetical protein
MDEDTNDDSNINSWPNMMLRYMTIIRVPWLNRRSRRDEWGFYCVGCEDLYKWPNHARRDFIMSTFREHLGKRDKKWAYIPARVDGRRWMEESGVMGNKCASLLIPS